MELFSLVPATFLLPSFWPIHIKQLIWVKHLKKQSQLCNQFYAILYRKFRLVYTFSNSNLERFLLSYSLIFFLENRSREKVTSRLRELKLVQSKRDIENPCVQIHSKREIEILDD